MIAIIGGSGLNELQGFTLTGSERIATAYGDEPVTISCGLLDGAEVCFLPRHGSGHTIPPHLINYRSNIDALKQTGVKAIIAVNAVGGISPLAGPGVIALPHQIIDYTWGREHTFYDHRSPVTHVEFGDPYDQPLRSLLQDAAARQNIPVWSQGVYGCTQGPRLETSAEIEKLRRDGCDLVGMTGMPEAALAREAGIAYACIALSVNWAAGVSEEPITMEGIYAVLAAGMGQIHSILSDAVRHRASMPSAVLHGA